MIHTASLFHDDVIDKSATRRGAPSVNAAFGNKVAILAGDFLLARASVSLARLRDVAAVELLSVVIEDLVRGETMQMKPPSLAPAAGLLDDVLAAAPRGAAPAPAGGGAASGDVDELMAFYLRKNYYK